jgi:hypothetical protein
MRPDMLTHTFPALPQAGFLAIDAPAVQGYVSAWCYPSGDVGVTVTYTTPSANTWMTQVWGGPLHGEAVVSMDGQYDHAVWAWRVAHADKTHPEWFPRRRRGH